MSDPPVVNFRFAPKMPINTRLMWIAILLFAGFAIQFSFSIWLGWLVFLVGCCLGIIRGKSIEPDVPANAEWKTTTIEELEDIRKLARQIGERKGRANAFRATSGAGCGFVFLTLVVSTVITIIIASTVDRFGVGGSRLAAPMQGGLVYPIWILDSLTILIPIWFAGWLNFWEPPQLPQKADYLLKIGQAYKDQPALEFVPSLSVSTKNDLSVPRDARMLVRFKDGPPEFIGIQIQISMNDVQGTKYPYSYSVIIAKKEFGLKQKALPLLDPPGGGGVLARLFKTANDRKELAFPQYNGSIVELSSESDVDVVVVRQLTSGTGYHTTIDQAKAVFANALGLANKILGR